MGKISKTASSETEWPIGANLWWNDPFRIYPMTLICIQYCQWRWSASHIAIFIKQSIMKPFLNSQWAYLSQVSDTGSPEPLVSSPDPTGHVSYCYHWESVVRPSSLAFTFQSSPLKPLDQFGPNLAGIVLGWSPFRIVPDDPTHQPRWPPMLKI